MTARPTPLIALPETLYVECPQCGEATARDLQHVDLADCLAHALVATLGDLVPGHCPGLLAERIERRAHRALAIWRRRPRA